MTALVIVFVVALIVVLGAATIALDKLSSVAESLIADRDQDRKQVEALLAKTGAFAPPRPEAPRPLPVPGKDFLYDEEGMLTAPVHYEEIEDI